MKTITWLEIYQKIRKKFPPSTRCKPARLLYDRKELKKLLRKDRDND